MDFSKLYEGRKGNALRYGEKYPDELTEVQKLLMEAHQNKLI